MPPQRGDYFFAVRLANANCGSSSQMANNPRVRTIRECEQFATANGSQEDSEDENCFGGQPELGKNDHV